MKIVFTGGGTGGHIFPILAIIKELQKTFDKTPALYYLGPKDNFARKVFTEEGVIVKNILCGKLRRYFTPFSLIQNFVDICLKLPFGFLQAFWYLFFLAPDLIFSKGGYGSLPTVIAGWLLGVPIFLHESDIVPGLANRLMGRLAIEIFVSFNNTEHFPAQKQVVVGNPIRKELLEGSFQRAKQVFNLVGDKPIALIMGGSQGARRLNDLILEILPEWLRHFEVIHITGTKNYEQVAKEAEVLLSKENKKYYHLAGFIDGPDLACAYKACHIVVARAGSGSIFEIAALGKPSVLIPLPEAAGNHQVKNAYAFAKTGAAIVIEQANLTPHFLLESARKPFLRQQDYKKMSQSALAFAKPRAAKIIAEYIATYLIS